MSGTDERLLEMADNVAAPDNRLAVLTLGEARATMELLQTLGAAGGDGAAAARHLASKLARRLPSEP
ncbi:hypothetical protein ACIQCG_01195 [Streptomyces noursei]|uniref:hypothetical protein n=1 Tax=Streptomyces noursei TaxID=1971 RepID=UPI0038097772